MYYVYCNIAINLNGKILLIMLIKFSKNLDLSVMVKLFNNYLTIIEYIIKLMRLYLLITPIETPSTRNAHVSLTPFLVSMIFYGIILAESPNHTNVSHTKVFSNLNIRIIRDIQGDFRGTVLHYL